MAIRNLLVAYNASASSDAALSAALFMSRKHDAHLTGLVATESRIDVSGRPWLPESLLEAIVDLDRRHVREIEARFLEACAGRIDDDRVHSIIRRGDADSTVAHYAQMYDLTLIGRHDAMQGSMRLELHPDRIALRSGRPILVIPPQWAEEEFRDNALIAWNGARSAARALMDALLILEIRREITVLTVEGRSRTPPLKGIDVATVLKRHGVGTTMVSVKPEGRTVGEIILGECEKRGAGLLVMGAYEHSKFSEERIAGVTNDVLQECPIPVLISQ